MADNGLRDLINVSIKDIDACKRLEQQLAGVFKSALSEIDKLSAYAQSLKGTQWEAWARVSYIDSKYALPVPLVKDLAQIGNLSREQRNLRPQRIMTFLNKAIDALEKLPIPLASGELHKQAQAALVNLKARRTDISRINQRLLPLYKPGDSGWDYV